MAEEESSAKAAVEDFLSLLDVYVVTDESGAPVLEEEPRSKGAGGRVGRLYLDEADANTGLTRAKGLMVRPLEVRLLKLSDLYLPLVAGGDTAKLGGHFFVVPAAEEVKNAQKLLGAQELGPDGVVPVFFCPSLEVERGEEGRVPAFLHESDLRESLRRSSVAAENQEVVVSTVDSVVSQLLKPKTEQSGAARLLVAVQDVRDIGLGKWR